MPKKVTTGSFVKDSIKIHGHKYSYYRVVYKKAIEKVSIWCNTCNRLFEMTPNSHKNGQGCPYCALRKVKLKFSLSYDDFIERAKKVHGDKYNYSLVSYKNSHEKVNIVCNKCKNIFSQTPTNHFSGNGCPKCGKDSVKLGIDEFIERANNWFEKGRYRYDKVVYYDTKTKVKIWCSVCNEYFYQQPSCHMAGHGHSKCCSGVYSKTNYGKSFKKSNLYLLHMFGMDENFYKLGITSKDIRNRFLKIKDYEYEVLYQKEFSGYDARALEIELHKLHKQYKYKPFIKFSGHTECFSYIDFDLVKEIIAGVNCGNHSKR